MFIKYHDTRQNKYKTIVMIYVYIKTYYFNSEIMITV